MEPDGAIRLVFSPWLSIRTYGASLWPEEKESQTKSGILRMQMYRVESERPGRQTFFRGFNAGFSLCIRDV
jgi:hypothetical protein